MVEKPPPSPRRNSIAMALITILFMMTLCVVPFVVSDPDEPVTHFGDVAPPVEVQTDPFLTFADPVEPVLIFPDPEPIVETGPPMVVHVLQHGESLNDVARSYGITVDQLVAANPGLVDQNILPGAEITIGPQTVEIIPETGLFQTQPLFATPAPLQSGNRYTVQPGDTLGSIAARYNITVQAILASNPQITDPDVLVPGQVIIIPSLTILPITGEAEVAPVTPVEQVLTVYIVQPGDTFSIIARAFNISLQDLIAHNPQVENPALIYPGQSINIPTP